MNGHRADHDCEGADRVAQHVHECGANVQVVVFVAVEAPHNGAVQYQAARGDTQHGPFGNGLRMQKALPGFVEDKERDSDQRQCIRESGENAGAMIAIGLHAIGWFGLETEAKRCQSDGQGVREIMAGVGNQRQAAGANSREQLNHREQKGRVERPLQNLSRSVMMMVQTLSLCFYFNSAHL